ncbi:hypothetical protein BGZ63DRAFT_387716 [Mariannaea sp. PMI_226]|nr:hypothetical protein BGZ63DRAFT_387716 [Mariannaea sp. PMI_226]
MKLTSLALIVSVGMVGFFATTADAIIPAIAIWAIGAPEIIGFVAQALRIWLDKQRLDRVSSNFINPDVGLQTFKRGSTVYNVMVCNKLAHDALMEVDRPYLEEIESTMENWLHGFGWYKELSVIYPGGSSSVTQHCPKPGGLVKCCIPTVHLYISFCPKGRGWDKKQLEAWDKSSSIHCSCDKACPAN